MERYCYSHLNTNLLTFEIVVMNNDLEQKRKRSYINRRSIMDIGMGLLIAGFGVYFMSSKVIKKAYEDDAYLLYLFAGLCILYGGFRVYRGVQKNYFKED
jgi:uncharacterized membrane protein